MELKNQQTLAKHIMRLLKVSYIDFPIGRTNKGNLALKFEDNGDFSIMLDSVPLSTKDILNDENNIELKRMIEKYWFESKDFKGFDVLAVQRGPNIDDIAPAPIDEVKFTEKKKRGRPKKTK